MLPNGKSQIVTAPSGRECGQFHRGRKRELLDAKGWMAHRAARAGRRRPHAYLAVGGHSRNLTRGTDGECAPGTLPECFFQSPRERIPQADAPRPCGYNARTVRGKARAGCVMRIPIMDRPRRDIPHPDVKISAEGCEETPIRAEGNRVDQATVGRERLELNTGGSVPNADGLVFARRGQRVTVGAVLDVPHASVVSAQHAKLLAVRHIPQSNGAIVSCGRQDLSIGPKGKPVDRGGVPERLGLALAVAGHAQHTNASIATGDEDAPSGSETDVPDRRPFVPIADQRIVFHSPPANMVIVTAGVELSRDRVERQGVNDGPMRLDRPSQDACLRVPRATSPSVSPEAIVRPSADTTTLCQPVRWLNSSDRHAPFDSTSHSRRAPSAPADQRRRPSGPKASALTVLGCPESLAESGAVVRTSKTKIAPLGPAAASRAPEGGECDRVKPFAAAARALGRDVLPCVLLVNEPGYP